MIRSYGSLFVLVVCCVSWSACGRSARIPPRAPVQGRVTLDGQPLTTGEVTFVPDASHNTRGPSAQGKVNADGQYSLRTDPHAGEDDGAIVGFHSVRVVARTPAPPGEPSRSLIPARYGNHATSGLQYEVKPDITNEILIELTSKR